MLIELKCKGFKKNTELTFLQESHSLITGFIEIHDAISGDLSRHCTEELKELGMDVEDCTLMALEGIISNMHIDTLPLLMSCCSYGSGLSNSKYLNAQIVLEDLYMQLRGNTENGVPYTLSELKQLATTISYALGDILFAFSHIIFYPLDAAQLLLTDEELTYTQPLQQFFSSINTTPEAYAKFIEFYRSKYVSVIPLFEDRPDEWEEITKNLPSFVVDTLIDYGSYIDKLDIRAFELGILSIDETYIDTLRERADSGDYIGTVAPNKWLQFIDLLRDDQISAMLPLVESLTPADLDVPISEGQVTDKYIKFLTDRNAGDIANATNFFQS